MRVWVGMCLAVAVASGASAAPNVTNATQKGSLLVFPDVRIDAAWNTLIRLQNDGNADVDVICYWMDGNKNRVDFVIPVTRDQAVWFDARTGNGTSQVNTFPQGPANGFDNPFLPGGAGPFPRGMLACWAVDDGAQNQIKWNHLSGTATLYNPDRGAYEYTAYAFFVPTGLDLQPVGTPGVLNLNGVEYDSCPLYMIGQQTPGGSPVPLDPITQDPVAPFVQFNRIVLTGCTINLNQDWTPVWTKLTFDVWNEDEVKFTGAFACADTWHELAPINDDLDAAGQNFAQLNLGTYAARYRVQGVKSTQCETSTIITQPVGVLVVQSTFVAVGRTVGSTVAAAGKFNGRIVWDAEGVVPEGAIR